MTRGLGFLLTNVLENVPKTPSGKKLMVLPWLSGACIVFCNKESKTIYASLKGFTLNFVNRVEVKDRLQRILGESEAASRWWCLVIDKQACSACGKDCLQPSRE